MFRELQSLIPSAGDTVAEPNDIPSSNIRLLPDVAMATLLALYNAVLTQGDWATQGKEAIVIPLLKARKVSLKAENYRFFS